MANIGIYVDLEQEIRKVAVATGRTTDQIGRQERMMISAKAITEQATDAMKKMTDGQVSDAAKLKAISAEWEDFWTTIELHAKTATLAVWDFMKAANDSFRFMVPELRPNPPATQSGTSISTQSLGGGDTDTGLPISLQAQRLDDERARRQASMRADFDRQIAALGDLSQRYDIDLRQGIATEEQVVAMKAENRMKMIALGRESLQQELQMERRAHADRVKLGFDTTESKIAEEQRFLGKVQEINLKLLENHRETSSAQQLGEAEKALARHQAEERLGQRMNDQLQSTYQMEERLRQQDLTDTETYYRGKIEMANARFATDREIAQKERELLSAQLAFRLRLSQGEANHLLFLRRTGDQEGVRDMLGRADPTLSPRAKEGLAESFSARDIELMERANGDFFAGWARGMQRYTRDTQNAFGFAQDMARRTAQTMEQGFQQMFFAPMERGFEGLLDNMLNMTKQIVSQIGAQLVTASIIQPATSGIGAFAGMFTGKQFATGGSGDFGRGELVKLHGPEAVVPLPDGRSIPVTMSLPDLSSMTVSQPTITMPVTVINQHTGAEVETQQTMGSNGLPQLEVVIRKAMSKAITEGHTDKAMRARFQLTPGET